MKSLIENIKSESSVDNYDDDYEMKEEDIFNKLEKICFNFVSKIKEMCKTYKIESHQIIFNDPTIPKDFPLNFNTTDGRLQ